MKSGLSLQEMEFNIMTTFNALEGTKTNPATQHM